MASAAAAEAFAYRALIITAGVLPAVEATGKTEVAHKTGFPIQAVAAGLAEPHRG
jgi:hypothetical protein